MKLNIDKKTFLVNLVFGEVYCNLNCDYCNYPKEQPRPLSRKEWNQFKDNISRLKNHLEIYFPSCKVLSITGGEPLLYPKIIEFIAKSFSSYKIRISSNGILLNDQLTQKFKKLGNVYFAISLDGHTSSSNSLRFSSVFPLKQITSNVNKLIDNDISVEILTTLHKKNIDIFWSFLKYLSSKYKQPIKDGKLWVLASPVVDWANSQSFSPFPSQISKFRRELKIHEEIDIVKNVRPYYKELDNYYADAKKRNICRMFEWALHVKYLGNSLWTDGSFLLYGCGCRGIKVLGKFDLKTKFDSEIIVKRKKSSILSDFFYNNCSICKNNCFNNWQLYDLYFQKKAGQEIKILKDII